MSNIEVRKRILITGVSGFIGKNILDHLLKQDQYDIFSLGRSKIDYKNHYSPCNITDLDAVQHVIKEVDPDIVLHFAANAIVKHNNEDPNGLLNSNVIGTNNILHCIKPNTKIIFASSIAVYDENTFLHNEDSATKAKSLYAASKIASENLFHAYKEYKNINYSIMRMSATIGNNLTHGLIFDIMRKLKLNSEYLELLGDCPGAIKPFTHILDVLSALDILLELDNLPQIVNVCVQDPISVEEVALTVMKTLNINKKIDWKGGNWSGDNKILHGYNGLMRSLNWTPLYNSKSAIEKCIKDYQNTSGSI